MSPNDDRYRSVLSRIETMRAANVVGRKTSELMVGAIDMMASGGLNPMAVKALREMHAILGRSFTSIDELLGLVEKLVADNMALRRDAESRTRTTAVS
jgi:hypothetical protein